MQQLAIAVTCFLNYLNSQQAGTSLKCKGKATVKFGRSLLTQLLCEMTVTVSLLATFLMPFHIIKHVVMLQQSRSAIRKHSDYLPQILRMELPRMDTDIQGRTMRDD